jgi:hypothetical protein
MKSEFSRNTALLVCLCLICIAIVPVVSAAGTAAEKVHVVSATQDQVKKINELWGSDITIGEYMEKVHPEQLVGVSDDVKNEMYKRKMHWPDGKGETTNSVSADGIQSALATLGVTGSLTIYTNHIQFTSTATCSQAASYIYVESFLENSAGSTVGSTSASSHDGLTTVTCSNGVYWPAAGDYHVYSYGYTITPATEGSATSGAQHYSG